MKKTSDVKKARIQSRNKRMEARNAKIEARKIEEALIVSNRPSSKNDKLTIEICIHCYNYQHRLCWMLSSLVQQKGDVPDIIVNISHSIGNGNPTTEEVCNFFKKKGLNIIETPIPEEKAHNRAIARNLQVENTKADWILFADSDMVYDPYFFDDLYKQLKADLNNVTKVMGADRVSLNIPFCKKYFEEDARTYPCVIPKVAEICSKWPVKWITGKKVAAGNFQLANVYAINVKANGKYTGRAKDVWRRTVSDRAFRCRMGGRQPIIVKPQYHLNHDRGGPEIQR